MNDRTLTVPRIYPTSPFLPKYGTLRRTRDQQPVPFLRLSGRCLEAAGFEIGSKVRIVVEEDRLVVEPADV